MTRKNKPRVGAILALAGIASAATTASVAAQSADPADAGKAVFKRANCFGCHKWHGNGGGGYGGDAVSLRKTELARGQITETGSCGGPRTGMPFFVRGAFDTIKKHRIDPQGGGSQMPPAARTIP